MRYVTIAVLALLVYGCQSMRPIEEPAERLHEQIFSEGLLAPGDEVRIVAASGTVHEFEITEIDLDARTIAGKDEAVDIASIVTLEKRVFSPLKTGFLIGGLVLGIFGTECEDDPSCDTGGGYFCC